MLKKFAPFEKASQTFMSATTCSKVPILSIIKIASFAFLVECQYVTKMTRIAYWRGIKDEQIFSNEIYYQLEQNTLTKTLHELAPHTENVIHVFAQHRSCSNFSRSFSSPRSLRYSIVNQLLFGMRIAPPSQWRGSAKVPVLYVLIRPPTR